MLLFVQKITYWRRDLLQIILSKIQVAYTCFSRIIGRQGSYLLVLFIKNSAPAIRMVNVFPCIEPVNGSFKYGISLCAVSCLAVFFYQVDRCIYTLICKGMAKVYLFFLIIGKLKSEGVSILTVSKVKFRCLDLPDAVAVIDRKFRFIRSFSIGSGRCFFNQCSFGNNGLTINFDIFCCIQPVNTSGKRIFGLFVLLFHTDCCLLAFI